MSETVVPPHSDRITSGAELPSGNGHHKVKKPKAKPAPVTKPKATKILPTDRLATVTQFEIARAYAIASGPDTKPVTNDIVAKLVKLQTSTIAMCNSFFMGIGFLQKTDNGFQPAPELMNYDRAFGWNAETAAQKLAPLIEKSWFMQALLPRLRFQGTMPEQEAIEILASEASAAQQHRKQLITLLEYAVTVGLIERENGALKLNSNAGSRTNSSPESKAPAPPIEQAGQTAGQSGQSSLADVMFPANANGAVKFQIAIEVSTAELSTWEPERLSRFFAGMAQVLAARGRDDKPK